MQTNPIGERSLGVETDAGWDERGFGAVRHAVSGQDGWEDGEGRGARRRKAPRGEDGKPSFGDLSPGMELVAEQKDRDGFVSHSRVRVVDVYDAEGAYGGTGRHVYVAVISTTDPRRRHLVGHIRPLDTMERLFGSALMPCALSFAEYEAKLADAERQAGILASRAADPAP